MKIGLISDTHDHFPASIHEIFKGVDHIIHAGDVCEEAIIFELQAIAPVTVVKGNNDFTLNAPLLARVTFGGMKFMVVHILSSSLARTEIAKEKPDIVIYGHTHVPKDESRDGVRYINPGSVYRGRDGAPRSVALLDLSPGAHGKIEFSPF